MDGNVTRHGITADLEAMQKAGIREAQIFNVGMGYQAGKAKYLSQEWLEMVKWAATEAKRLGMTLCMHNGPGWSSSGGYWVTPEQSMQRVVWTETTIESTGKEQVLNLKRPDAVRNYYEDIVTLAFPTPKADQRIKDFRLKSLGTDSSTDRMLPANDDIAADAIVGKQQVIVLSTDAEGNASVALPKGKWTILRMGHTSTGTTSHPVNDVTGGGLECDKLSAEAMDAFWNDGIQPVLDYLGPLSGTVLNNLLIDSYETGCGNWTPRFREEFRRRMGYDCYEYYPVLAGFAIGSSQESERFLWDLRRVCSELMAENYYDHFRDLCHQRGILFSTEPYTGPFDDLRVGAPSDIVMGEFWMGDGIMSSSAKVAASVAHIGGKSIVGAEAFTAAEPFAKWAETHADMKTLGDKYWCAGINRFIFHTYVHQPEDKGPGYTLERYGSHLNRLNPIWSVHKHYIDYVNRSQYLLQQGRFVGDVLAFVGESAPNNGDLMEELKRAGYDYDEIWTEALSELTVRNGIIYTPCGSPYRVLALRNSRLMTPATLREIERLARAGAIIVGEKPTASPSLSGYPGCDNEVRAMADALWDSNMVKNISVQKALRDAGVQPDFQANNFSNDFMFIHRQTDDAEIYFVSNQTNKAQKVTARFRVTGLQPEWWEPLTGRKSLLPVCATDGDMTELQLFLQPTQSGFVVFRNEAKVQYTQGSIHYYTEPEVKPLPGLEVISAQYGHFLPQGVMDVTDQVAGKARGGKVSFTVGNEWGDPCFGIVKHILVTYTTGGSLHKAFLPEGQPCVLPLQGEEGELRIRHAFYGALDEDFAEERPASPHNVKEKIEEMLTAGGYKAAVSEVVSGLAVDETKENTLRVVYRSAGRLSMAECKGGDILDLSDQYDLPVLASPLDGKTLTLTTPHALKYETTGTDGRKHSAKVKKIPAPITLAGQWNVSFEGQYAAAPVTLDTLRSLSENSSEEVRAFCGTAVYRTTVCVGKEYFRSGTLLRMELGDVVDAAEVIINGNPIGCVWCHPFHIDATEALHQGENTVEIRVSIPWANRLISEEKSGQKTTFHTFQHWNKDDALQPSGLLKDIVIRPFKCVGI